MPRLKVLDDDPMLVQEERKIVQRVQAYQQLQRDLDEREGGILAFAEGYKVFGFVRIEAEKKWIFTEWLPNANRVFLVGDFNEWKDSHPLKDVGFGRWSIDLPDLADGTWALPHMCKHRIRMRTSDGKTIDRIPAWTKMALQDHMTNLFNGVFYEPPADKRYKFKYGRPAKPEVLKIYEAHVGMGLAEERVATYLEFKDVVLPRIQRLGYTAVQLMAVAEHAYYGSFGYHVTNFFAPSSRSGAPDELKELVDVAHSMGILVFMDLVHAHASSNQIDGIASMDGTDHCYTHGGAKGHHSQWDSALFHVAKWEVMRFLLSNCRWWLEEYNFDGFRFDGITSMLYHSHGIEGTPTTYADYFGPDCDTESCIYMMLANSLIHQLLPETAITIGEDVSGMPTLCRPVSEGGFGFDYRLAMAQPDMWIKYLKDMFDDDWKMGHIVYTLQNRRYGEKCVAYAESHDQCIVGDKTIAFLLMDAKMYTHMSISSEPDMVVDRGVALHKMIRLLTLGLGGEAYLGFIGNEFGHPEWVDFPREANNWSYHHCRRRWDLADSDDLKYKLLGNFEELMQQCDGRFKFSSAEHQYVSRKDEDEKVIVFERGPCLFVFNLHPTHSYTDFRVGHTWNEGMRIVLDSDEGRVGGHKRLEHGHLNSFPVLDGWDNRYHSCKLYAPSRTVQVLVRDSLLTGGIRVFFDKALDVQLTVQLLGADGSSQLAAKALSSDAEMSVQIPEALTAAFVVLWETGSKKGELAGGPFYAHFPGNYLVMLGGSGQLTGYMRCLGGSDDVPHGSALAQNATVTAEAAVMPSAEATAHKAGYERGGLATSEETSLPTSPGEAEPTMPPSVFENIPEYMAAPTDIAPSSIGMSRVASLSVFQTLLDNEGRMDLRSQMEKATVKGPPAYEARHLTTPIVIVTSEVNPWSKSGGLGMVASSYAYEFAVKGHRTMCISPRYNDFKNQADIGRAKIWLNGGEHEVHFFHEYLSHGDGKGCDYVFVDHLSYRRPSGLYWNPEEGKEYGDNLFRFALLCLAALEAPLILNMGGSTLGEDVLFLANDWQTGLLPVYLHYKYKRNCTYLKARSMFVIHNMGYQGKYSTKTFPIGSHLGLHAEVFKECLWAPGANPDCLNVLCAGVKMADRVLTVSPNYMTEIQSPEGGFGLHDVLQSKGKLMRAAGILNGISDEWNPATDPDLAANYTIADFESGKAKCKAALQEELGLQQDPNVVFVGFCGRLCSQKGVNLLVSSIDWMMHDTGNNVTGRVQLVVMGKGDVDIGNMIKDAERRYPGRVCGYVGFDPRVEHRMMAGCDLFLMPSKYEPCGLPQMYAQQYGTLPVVHDTGGLKDSVKGLWDETNQWDLDNATGFLFSPFAVDAMKQRLYQAMAIFHHKKNVFKNMQLSAMNSNFYWPAAINEYEKHIDWTLDAQSCV